MTNGSWQSRLLCLGFGSCGDVFGFGNKDDIAPAANGFPAPANVLRPARAVCFEDGIGKRAFNDSDGLRDPLIGSTEMEVGFHQLVRGHIALAAPREFGDKTADRIAFRKERVNPALLGWGQNQIPGGRKLLAGAEQSGQCPSQNPSTFLNNQLFSKIGYSFLGRRLLEAQNDEAAPPSASIAVQPDAQSRVGCDKHVEIAGEVKSTVAAFCLGGQRVAANQCFQLGSAGAVEKIAGHVGCEQERFADEAEDFKPLQEQRGSELGAILNSNDGLNHFGNLSFPGAGTTVENDESLGRIHTSDGKTGPALQQIHVSIG